MDIFAFFVLAFIAFSMFRAYLRRTFMCLLDIASYFISITIALFVSNPLGHAMYTTKFYTDVKKSISGIVNFNAILASSESSIKQKTLFIENLNAPSIITDFVVKNNNSVVYEVLGVKSFEEYITAIFMYIIMRTIAFFISFAILYFIIYLIKLSLVPYIDFNNFGLLDSAISVVLGAVKALVVIYLILLFIPALFVQFNYLSLYSVINESVTLSFLYDSNPLLKFFLRAPLY